MATRYSGNVELRIELIHIRGWNGRMGWFYKAHITAPHHSAEAILSPREADVKGDLRSSDAYDQAARAFLSFADRETGGLMTREANFEGNARMVKRRERWQVLRVQQSPCPLEEDLEIERNKRRLRREP